MEQRFKTLLVMMILMAGTDFFFLIQEISKIQDMMQTNWEIIGSASQDPVTRHVTRVIYVLSLFKFLFGTLQRTENILIIFIL